MGSVCKEPLLTVREICQRLRKEYGPVKLGKPLPPLGELVATILSQNTSDRNSDAAFEELRRRFKSWDAVRRAPVGKIARAIRRGGLSRQKAPRIKAVLQAIYEEHGKLSLDFLHAMPTAKALEYLRNFAGVGPKTAACVLLFACRKPVLPVDTHVLRVSGRLGLIGPKTNAEKAHEELAQLVPRRKVLDFHIQIIRHGRRVCTAQRPRCTECVLLDLCPEGKRRMGMKDGACGLSRAGK
ncbi:MAG: endonuclease III [Planctomycetia bacterium]|nr:endonuclease III [Planctomycetia bacterium]